MGVKHPSLIRFDCDGVLVDTETLSNDFMAGIITRRGFPITGAQCRQRFVGLKLLSVRDKILAEDGFDLGDDFADEMYDGLPDLFAKGVNAIEGVETAIKAIRKAGIPYCVGSSGKIEKMHMTLGSCGLLPYFEDVLFSAWNVARGKPHPDLFLHAANQMGHDLENCVVVEDSAFGVQAGMSAGMRVLAYAGDPTSNRQALEAAGGELFDKMSDLPKLIGI